MPIYEYACASCGHEFERILRAGQTNPPCPECASEVDKKISLSSFKLKGGGWYSDLYSGKDNKRPAPPSTSGDSSKSASESSPSTPSKSKSSDSSSSSD